MRVFKLQFYSALHVDSKGSGEPEVAEEFIHSDTLSAALCLAWNSLYPETGDDFFLSPPFRLSSAFPYIKDILLFPTPAWNFWKETDPLERKKLKKIQWLSKGLLECVLNGHPLSLSETKIISSVIAISQEEGDANPEALKSPPWIITERQRVAVDRLGIPGEGGLFFFALQFFAPEAGLYFMVDIEDQELPKFRAALAYLGDTGIGADRNSGLGHFAVLKETEFQMKLPSDSNAWFTLSLFNPGLEDDIEELAEESAYRLLIRTGWISGTTVGRPPIKVFGEGSRFSRRPVGRVVPMLPDEVKDKYGLPITHSAARDLRATALPCVWNAISKGE